MADRFSVVKRGYSTEEVDKYIDTLETTIRSYKDKDNSIKNAIVSAQIAADNIVRNSDIQANETRVSVQKQLKSICESINVQKEMLKEFQSDYNNIMSKYLKDFNDQDIVKIFDKINFLEEYIAKLAPDNASSDIPSSAQINASDSEISPRSLD